MFEAPEVIATFDRSFGGKKERLQLERGEYNGRPTFTLRVCWQTPEGQWRWSAAKPNANGKTWLSLTIKARELAQLGEALIKAATNTGDQPRATTQRRGVKDNPKRQAERARFEEGNADHRVEDDADIPF